MTKNEIVGRLKAGGLDASSTNRSAAVYVADAMAGRAVPGWFAYRIVCDSEATGRRARAILSRWYDIDANGNVWRLRSKNRIPLMAIKRGGVPPAPPTPTGDYMYFEAAQDGSTVSMISMLATAPNLEYSTDGYNWQEWQHATAGNTHTFDTITLTAVGDRVYLRGENPNGYLDFESSKMSFFSMTGKIAAHGNAQSLVDGDNPTLVAKTMPMFSNAIMMEVMSDVLVSAPSLPATELAESCYAGMFYGCTGLTQAPSLPATELAESCYASMFSGCTGLTQAPSLPATELAESCYASMFYGCTGLTQAPSLPATVLAESCYTDMFNDCTGLTQAPSLPATELAESCYASMFYGCTGLTQAPSLPATVLEVGCYAGMFNDCTSLTAAANMPQLTTIGDHSCGYMYSGCTSLTAAAAMPNVTTISDDGCGYMYSGCTSLTAAAAMPQLTTIGDSGCGGMYSGCTFDMSDDGTTLNFDFPTPPITAGETTYSTAYDVASWMGNTNGFTNP